MMLFFKNAFRALPGLESDRIHSACAASSFQAPPLSDVLRAGTTRRRVAAAKRATPGRRGPYSSTRPCAKRLCATSSAIAGKGGTGTTTAEVAVANSSA